MQPSRSPVKQDGLDQGDDVPAGIISGADDRNVDCLESEQEQGEQLDRWKRAFPVLPTSRQRKTTLTSHWDHQETENRGCISGK